jgi:catechol 2,3-dioxygenase-like lactoylglutathione lyase family enzyme
MNGGIIFFRTTKLAETSQFYREEVGCELWLDQGGCHILKFSNLLFGLCQRESADTQGMITFVYRDRESVDGMYRRLEDIAESSPRDNPDYRIYHFFARDPDGRAVEFQFFWDELHI